MNPSELTFREAPPQSVGIPQQPAAAFPSTTDRESIHRIGRWFLVCLAIFEVSSALFLASINPVRGYDENWYLINSHRLQGITALPYADFRPPMLPTLLALLGSSYWLAPGLAHIGSSVLVFLILRRLVTPNFALGGTMVFLACAEMRVYNVFLLTEMPAIFFLLLAVYAFVVQRPCLLGAAAAFAFMTHWSMAAILPLPAVMFARRRRWGDAGWFVTGAALAAAPFLIGLGLTHGNPLGPFTIQLRAQRTGANDWSYYLREFPQLPVVLVVGGLVAARWLWRNRAHPEAKSLYEPCLFLLGIVCVRVAVLHVVTAKDPRYLAPLFPILLILSVVMLWYYWKGLRLVQWGAWTILLVSMMPFRSFYWQVHRFAADPTHQIAKLRDDIAATDPRELIYTDFNDLAVMGQTGHRAIPVTGVDSWHHKPFDARGPVLRSQIPIGALYLTWKPGPAEIIARSEHARNRPLWLVRWKGEEPCRVARP